jgi:hypothetical protein
MGDGRHRLIGSPPVEPAPRRPTTTTTGRVRSGGRVLRRRIHALRIGSIGRVLYDPKYVPVPYPKTKKLISAWRQRSSGSGLTPADDGLRLPAQPSPKPRSPRLITK